MKNIHFPIIAGLLCLLSAFNSYSQSWRVNDIPDDLLKEMHAVVRSDRTEFTVKDESTATKKQTIVITVLDEYAAGADMFHCFTDSYIKLSSFSGELFDRNGRSIRKIKKGDLRFTDYFPGLASDTRRYYYSPEYGSYPYTVRYEYETVYRNKTFAYPVFSPVADYSVSVENASYVLTVPTGFQFLTRAQGMEQTPKKTVAGNTDVYEWSVSNFNGIRQERFSPPVFMRLPLLYVTPHSFVFGKTSGKMTDWASYSQWQWELMRGREAMPEGLKREVADITRNATSDKEKIKALYDFLGATTRYVSLQIGLGGFQPMTVEEVYKNKFGDCKALSFYMQAMLAECGISSYYSEIGVGNTTLIEDFVHPSQTNHAILQVPLEGETLWLECTNPELPFGYTHRSIAGEKALVYKDGTAEIVRIDTYADSLNLYSIEAEVALSADGSAAGHVSTTRSLYRYEQYLRFANLSEREQINRLKTEVALAGINIGNVSCEEDKSGIPAISIGYDMSSPIFGSITGSRIFVPVNAFRKRTGARLNRPNQRKSDVVVGEGYVDRDVITITYPETMQVEAGLIFKELDTRFGRFELKMLPLEGKVIIIREMILYSGRYDREHYAEFKEFLEECDKITASQLVFTKK